MEAIRGGQGGPIQTGTANFEVQNRVTQDKNDIKSDTSEIGAGIDRKDYKEQDVKKAIEKLNKFLEDNGTYAEYEIHDKLKDVMIKIRDSKTKEVIREIPPKKILDMVASMLEMVGVLVDKKA